MVKPAGQKRWTAPGALQGPGWASRVPCTLLGDPPKALPPALPVRTSPSSRSVEGEPRAVAGLLGRFGGGRARAWYLGLLPIQEAERVVGEEWGVSHRHRALLTTAAFEGLLWDGAGPRGGDGSGVVVVPSRTPRSSTVPCTEAVPTWGVNVGTGPRPSGPAARWACRRRPIRRRACFRTPRVGPVSSLMSVSMWG